MILKMVNSHKLGKTCWSDEVIPLTVEVAAGCVLHFDARGVHIGKRPGKKIKTIFQRVASCFIPDYFFFFFFQDSEGNYTGLYSEDLLNMCVCSSRCPSCTSETKNQVNDDPFFFFFNWISSSRTGLGK